MVRPEVPDPRDPDAPIRYDDEEMDKARGRITVGELTVDTTVVRVGYELPAEPLGLPEIDPARLAALRARRDELIPLLRRILGHGRE